MCSMEKKNQRLAKDISENRIKADLKTLKKKKNTRKLYFGIWFAFLLFFFFLKKKKIQFNLFLVLHFKKVHQNTDIFFLAKSVKQSI